MALFLRIFVYYNTSKKLLGQWCFWKIVLGDVWLFLLPGDISRVCCWVFAVEFFMDFFEVCIGDMSINLGCVD